ncbi:hypothetical protein SEA_EDUGATOR_84 [Mycobacterium phage Edugator]|uniref:Uncharacterized protein n=1 Tax=Mycobacterium phage Edugator TaxID=2015843 RepID=A0A222ZNS4_9CAUD|nr:hypothetical protein SEA_EDUGATOR_84 [Mycobacterium phage Edugator]
MSTKQPTEELARMLDNAATMAEVHDEIMGDDVDLTGVKVTRGGPRSRVLQIRLNDDELAELERQAAARDLPASTVAREILLRTLFPRPAADVVFFRGEDAAEALQRFVEAVVELKLDARIGTGAAVPLEAYTIPGKSG